MPKKVLSAKRGRMPKGQQQQQQQQGGSDDDDDEGFTKTLTVEEALAGQQDSATKATAATAAAADALPTSNALGASEANLVPFSATTTTQQQQLQEARARALAAATRDDDDDDVAFEAGIVQADHGDITTTADLIAEARLRRGLEVTHVAEGVDVDALGAFGRGPEYEAEAAAAGMTTKPKKLAHKWWGHNRNSITCVAAVPPNLVVTTSLAGAEDAATAGIQQQTGWSAGAKMLCCFGDKSGRTWVVLDGADKPRVPLEPPQRAAVLCVAVSDAPPAASLSNERTSLVATKQERHIIAAGAADGTIFLWSGITLAYRGLCNLHKQAVTGLTFRAGTHTLYSVAKDSVLRVWDALEPPARPVDKLFGHTMPALCVAASASAFLEAATAGRGGTTGGRCVSGGDDRVPRLWKVDAATESEFAEPGYLSGAIECVCVVGIGGSANFGFAVGTSTGVLALYDANKRAPLWHMERAHGADANGDGTGLEASLLALEAQTSTAQAEVRRAGAGNPVTALAAVPGGDLVASGSGDGSVRLWRVVFSDTRVSKAAASAMTKTPAQLELMCDVAIPGWINGLSFSFAPESKCWSLYVACAKEQRLGRWVVFARALNGVLRLPLNADDQSMSAAAVAAAQKKKAAATKQGGGVVQSDDQQHKSMSSLRQKFMQAPAKRAGGGGGGGGAKKGGGSKQHQQHKKAKSAAGAPKRK